MTTRADEAWTDTLPDSVCRRDLRAASPFPEVPRAFFGLRCVDRRTGVKATFGGLLKVWLVAGYLVVLSGVIPVLGAVG